MTVTTGPTPGSAAAPDRGARDEHAWSNTVRERQHESRRVMSERLYEKAVAAIDAERRASSRSSEESSK